VEEQLKQSKSLNENPGCLSLFKPRQKDKSSITEASVEPGFSFPYAVNDHFLTNAELSFYLQAREVLSDKYILCPKVSIAEILNITEKDYRASQTAFNKISRKRVDFVVCEAEAMKVLYAIELDDSSHDSPSRQERDDFVNKAFEAADLPLLHVDCKRAYSYQDMIGILFAPLQPKKATPVTQQTPAAGPVASSAFVSSPQKRAATPPPLPVKKESTINVICPKCGAPMKKVIVKAGAHAGDEYSVCSNYPQCQSFYPTGKGAKK
jgi:hypothetical protein